MGEGASPVIGELLHVLRGQEHAVLEQAALDALTAAVCSRSRSAASTPMTPHIPPMMSLTEVPARIGWPGGPVM